MKTTIQQQRRRKALLFLPLVIFCFTTIIFNAFGGGQTAEKDNFNSPKGFNSKLPDANVKPGDQLGKMGFYNRASADSEKLKQAQRSDPYARSITDSAATKPGIISEDPLPFGYNSPFSTVNDPGAKTKLIGQRLAQLQAEVNRPALPGNTAPGYSSPVTSVKEQSPISTAKALEDPELKQMSGLLEKILDIQHPGRLRERENNQNKEDNPTRFQAIPAIIDGNQKIIQGTVIRLRLIDSVRLNGEFFPKGQLIYGSGDLYNQRVKINIKLLHVGLNIIPVDLTVFDRTDGMEGISVPEAVTGDAVRDGAVNGIQNMDVMSFDPSIGAQLTTAGINTAKGLFSKKVKRVKGKLKNGHALLLRDNLALKPNY